MVKAESFLKRNMRTGNAASRSHAGLSSAASKPLPPKTGSEAAFARTAPAWTSPAPSTKQIAPLPLPPTPSRTRFPIPKRNPLKPPIQIPSLAKKTSVGGIVAACFLGVGIFAWMVSGNDDAAAGANHGYALTPRQLDEFVTPKVLAILTEHGSGSGFPLTARDVLTNRHVVDDVGENATVKVFNEKWNGTRRGTVNWISSKADLAWIKMNEDIPVEPLKIADEKLRRGDKVYAYGYPKQAYRFGIENLNVRGTEGSISAVDMPRKGVLHYEHTAAINNGNSGGPLFNNRGEIVGINTWMYTDANSAYYAIEIGELRKVFHSLWDMAHGKTPDYCEFMD